jgi:hypothetical protein
MNYLSIRLDNYAARNTEIATRILHSGQNEYAFGNQTEELHPSQARNQPIIHGYSPYNHSISPSRGINALEHNNLPYSTDKFSHQGYTYSQTWPQMTPGQVYGSGGLNAKINGGIVAETRQELQPNGIPPYGGTGHPQAIDYPWLGAESYDLGPTGQNATMEAQRISYTEETKVRGRGRPRVNPKDETTAEVSTPLLIWPFFVLLFIWQLLLSISSANNVPL